MEMQYSDMSFLRENTFDNTNTMRELIQIYLDTTPEMLENLKDAADNFDETKVKNAAHKLRSSFGTMGVAPADELLHDIENSTHKMGKLGVLAALEKLMVIADQVEIELDHVMTEL